MNNAQQSSVEIAIFGAGSIGCYLGGQLLNAGLKVTFLGREKFRKALLTKGLCLTHFENRDMMIAPSGINFSLEPKSISKADIILVTVKSQDTEIGAKSIAKFAKADALIISFQNGVSNIDVLKRYLPTYKILGGVVPFNVTGIGPGHFHCGTEGNLSIEAGDARLKPLSEAFSTSKQGVDIYETILPVQWGKLLVNLNNALNALTGRTLREGLIQRDYRRALAMIISEALNVVRGAGIEPANFGKASAEKMIKILRLPDFIYKIIMNRIVKIDASARSSMLDDLEMGRVSEIEYLQGAIVKLAEQTNQRAPYNKKILHLVNQAFLQGESPLYTGSDICSKLGI